MEESPQCGTEIPDRIVKGFGWRVALTIVVSFGWLIFLIIWLGFFAADYSGYQNLAISLVSVLVLAGILAVTWAVWAMKMKPPIMKAE